MTLETVDWNMEAMLSVRVVIAAVLGAGIGWERQRGHHQAGMRTHAAVCLGSCVFGLVSAFCPGGADRIAAQVASGVGFLGAGVILREQGQVHGLTTAATIWATAAVGLAVAYGYFVLATLCAVIIFCLLSVHLGPPPPGSAAERPRSSSSIHDVQAPR